MTSSTYDSGRAVLLGRCIAGIYPLRRTWMDFLERTNTLRSEACECLLPTRRRTERRRAAAAATPAQTPAGTCGPTIDGELPGAVQTLEGGAGLLRKTS